MSRSFRIRGHRANRVRAQHNQRPTLLILESRTVPSSLNVAEVEPNNTYATANLLALGFDAGEDTRMIVNGSIGATGDHDWFRVELNKGDVISAGVRAQNGLDPTVGLWKAEGAPGALTELVFNDNSRYAGWQVLPSESPLSRLTPHYTDSEVYYLITAPGAYYFEVAASPYAAPNDTTGGYHMELVLARPAMEAQPVGAKQILFVDFDGAAVNISDFGRGWGAPGTGTSRLSPLSAFLPNWGLTAADENAVIDATLATIRDKLSDDIRARGLNGDFASSGVPGEFAIDIRNSRDDADEFGSNPYVSRIVIGGTLAEFGTPIMVAISSTIDPGNFSFDDQAVVTLEQLSGPASSPISLNKYDGLIDPSRTKAELVGMGVGSIAAHEAGHFFGNWHTFSLNDHFDLMDGNPYSLDLTIGVGPDGRFGTADDADVDFGVDQYNPFEYFAGREETLNNIAFGLATGKGVGSSMLAAGGAASGDSSHLRSFGWDGPSQAHGIDLRTSRHAGLTLVAGQGIWLDTAAGPGRIADMIGVDDSPLSNSAIQSQRQRPDLLALLEPEMGNRLEYGQEDYGTIIDTLASGKRKLSGSDMSLIDFGNIDGWSLAESLPPASLPN